MSSAQKNPVRFTQDQIEWLERTFPEITATTDKEELLYNAGKRYVLSVIKEHVKVGIRYVIPS